MTRFTLGRCVITPTIQALDRGHVMACLARHQAGDWGEVCAEDKAANDAAVGDGDRILSVYAKDPKQPFGDGNQLWVITEADRSATTVLLPEDY